jgi:hypothetical protein
MDFHHNHESTYQPCSAENDNTELLPVKLS